LVGSYQTMSKQTCRKAFWSHPLVTFKAIMLIHWQALKLVIKGATYFKKPKQKAQKQSATDKLNKIINIKKYEK